MCIPQRDVAIASDGIIAVLFPQLHGCANNVVVQWHDEEVFDDLPNPIWQYSPTVQLRSAEETSVDELAEIAVIHGGGHSQ
jgi:hypothetical protein